MSATTGLQNIETMSASHDGLYLWVTPDKLMQHTPGKLVQQVSKCMLELYTHLGLLSVPCLLARDCFEALLKASSA